MVSLDTEFADDTDENLNRRKFVMLQEFDPVAARNHNGFRGGEFVVDTPKPEVAAEVPATEAAAAPVEDLPANEKLGTTN